VTTRRTSITRVLDFFREANTDEVRAVLLLMPEVLTKRHIQTPGPSPRRGRPPRANGDANAKAAEGGIPLQVS
jgi:hypothetical protein